MPLFCEICGQEQTSSVDVCPCRGNPVRRALGSACAKTIAPQPSDDLYGVGGWLLLFCLTLTFVAPITHALIAARALTNLATARVPIQTLIRLGSVGAIYAGLAVFSFIAGLMLWMEKPEGLNVAKAYLMIGAALPIVLFLLLRLAGLHVDLFRVVVARLAYFVPWYSYLLKSHRVMVTYGRP